MEVDLINQRLQLSSENLKYKKFRCICEAPIVVLEKRIYENYISSNFSLRELWNCDWKLILCPPQNKRKDNQHSKLPSLKINFHVSTYGKLDPPLAQHTSKNGWLPSFQWQKEIHYYFKGWMTVIRVVK